MFKGAEALRQGVNTGTNSVWNSIIRHFTEQGSHDATARALGKMAPGTARSIANVVTNALTAGIPKIGSWATKKAGEIGEKISSAGAGQVVNALS